VFDAASRMIALDHFFRNVRRRVIVSWMIRDRNPLRIASGQNKTNKSSE
jgi:hypothetical protein